MGSSHSCHAYISESGEPNESSETDDLNGSLAQTFLEQRCNESGEPGEPNESGESDDLKGSFSANIFETKRD